jgi:Mrp family chromosome partitioning ATPase
VIVTLAEDSDANGRPLAAVALARAIARIDVRPVLIDFRGDGANSLSMGETAELPGFSDLFAGDASFAQAIFRDRRSRVHFIPAGLGPLPDELAGERLNAILQALDLTYDHVIVDVGNDLIPVLAPEATVAVVVSEHNAEDPRTEEAFARITSVSAAKIMLLMVDPRPTKNPRRQRRKSSRKQRKAPPPEPQPVSPRSGRCIQVMTSPAGMTQSSPATA